MDFIEFYLVNLLLFFSKIFIIFIIYLLYRKKKKEDFETDFDSVFNSDEPCKSVLDIESTFDNLDNSQEDNVL